MASEKTEKDLAKRLNALADVATKLERLAKERGTSLYKIAKELQIPRGSIYYFAKNPGRLPLETVKAMARKLGCTVVDLVSKLETEI